jgi:aryl-alcohol dehydrogenase-like predicted oxidoreductase
LGSCSGYAGTTPQIEQSLESLRTEAIDLYYLHRVDPGTPIEESLGAIAEYREAGGSRRSGSPPST